MLLASPASSRSRTAKSSSRSATSHDHLCFGHLSLKGHELQRPCSLGFHYLNLPGQYSRLGVEDFDFAHYNRTPYCGLEIHIPNAYANAMLQVCCCRLRDSCFDRPRFSFSSSLLHL
jgi:PAB-dependent poly(A)-specific ribonuclease subunit 2